jgi:transmembrane sensor
MRREPDDTPRDALDPIDREAQDWVVRFASGEATSDDLQEGKRWCEQSPAHAAAFARASRLWDGLGPGAFAGQPHVGRRAALVRMTRRAVIGGAVAASAAGAAALVVRPPFALWPSWSELTADYRTATGEQRHITLAGRASIEMNTQTSIVVRRGTSAGGQIELVAGEAMIATLPGASAPLTVTAGEGRAQASNARFNLRRDRAAACVTCLDGTVQVEYGTATLALQERQQITYDGRGLGKIAAVDPAVVTAWQDGMLIFHATPLRQVIEDVNRYRPGRIILMNEQLAARLFSADFHIRNVDAVIPQIQRLFGAKVTSLPGGIVLLS